MIRYINKQKQKYSCGPIAIANALKWSGWPVSYVQVTQWCENLGVYDPFKGMQVHDIGNTIKLVLKVNQIKVRNMRDLDKTLKKGSTLIWTMKHGDIYHTVFVSERKKDKYVVLNLHKSGKSRNYSRKYIQKLIRQSNKNVAAYELPKSNRGI